MIFLTNPLHYALHHNLRWRLADQFDFIKGHQSVTVARGELAHLASHLLLAVQTVGSDLQVVALIDERLYQSPPLTSDGQWKRGPIPITLRYHPFSALRDARRPHEALLGVVADHRYLDPVVGEAFFDDLARPLPRVLAVQRRLMQIVIEKKQLATAAKCLRTMDVLVPLDDGVMQGRRGFSTVDIEALSSIPASRIAAASTRPHDIVQLAAALDLSAGLHLAPLRARGSNQSSAIPSLVRNAPAIGQVSSPSSFLVDDEFVMTFEN